MKATPQVNQNYYAKPKYGSVERFIAYQHQIALIRDSGVKKILLVGRGDGVVPYYLKNVLGLEVTILDIDPALKPDIVGDVRNLPCTDSEYEAVAVFEVLEHLPYEDLPGILRELARVSQDKVFVSLPYRNTGIDLLVKFPYIRTLFNRTWLRLMLVWPITFPGFEISGQHYWEIDTVTTKRKVKALIKEQFIINSEAHGLFDAYRYVLSLSKKRLLTNTYAKDYYNTYLQKLEDDYKTARWFSSPSARLDYDETKAVILRALRILKGKGVERTLEIGPGDGVWTDLILPHTKELTLLDQSEEMIERAKKRLAKSTHITYVCSDFLSYHTEHRFDLICAIRCFEYFDNKKRAMKKISQLVKPGGRLVLVTKNPNHVRNQGIQNKNLHRGQSSREEMERLLSTHGFDAIEVLPATFRIKSTNAIMRVLSKLLHGLHVRLGGWFQIPYITDWFTESYIYVATKK